VNKIIASLVSAIFCLLPLSCASTQTVKRPPAFRLADVTLSKAVGDESPIPSPKNPATIFSRQDSEIVAFVKLINLWGVHILKWDWFDPKGKLYYSTGDYKIKCGEGKYLKEVSTWHELSIRGEPQERVIGHWTLNVYLDKEIVAVRTFTIGDSP
jgi:hypothetical protein